MDGLETTIFVVCSVLLIGIVCNKSYKLRNRHPQLETIIYKVQPIFEQSKTFCGNLTMLNHRNPLHEIDVYPSTKSFTVNKNVVYLCLENTHGVPFDTNTLIYVFIHELAHVLCDEIGHTEKYKAIFNQLIKEATDLHIYDPDVGVSKFYPAMTQE